MCATYRDKERRSNFQSFANKILTGIKEIISDYAEKRAIWELFQNALDTIEKNGEIKIIKTDLGFKFIHNGKPFKDEHIGGLIKQFSNGKTYGDNSENIGQYGTGFLSTHVYGKNVIINSAVINDAGILKTLKDFNLNRTSDNIEILTDDLISQDDLIADLCDNPGNEEYSYSETIFEYEASEYNKRSIDVMFQYIPDILPYIFCFNEKLTKVIINSGIEELVYFEPEFQTDIFILKSTKNPVLSFNYIENKDCGLKLIIPNKILNVPKQFLFFPLMDTSDFGVNFLIHARDFKPNKERDYLHLNESSEELLMEVELNKSLLTEAFDLIINRATKDENIEFIPFCNIKFNDLDTDFLIGLKKLLVESIIDLKRLRISNNDDYASINDIAFFGNDILNFEIDIQEAFYIVFSEFYDLPNFEEYIFLSKRVNEWKEFNVESIGIITLKDFLIDISNKTTKNLLNVKNRNSYEKIIYAIREKINLLNEVEVIPNMHNILKSHNDLRRWDIIEHYLIKSMVDINYPISESYLNEDFYFIDSISPYNRENFKEDFNRFCNQLNDRLHKSDDIEIDLSKLINPLHYFINLNKTTELNVAISAFFGNSLNLEFLPDKLESPTKDIIYHPAIKLLSRIYVREILNNSPDRKVDENDISNIFKLLSILNANTNIKEELLDKFECIPNQNNFLRAQSNLKLDHIHDNNFKLKYQEIVGKDIKDDLANVEFNEFLQHQNTISGDELGKEIEIKLNSDRKFIPIKDTNGYVDEKVLNIILDLIKGIS